jgi:hypothetical protein
LLTRSIPAIVAPRNASNETIREDGEETGLLIGLSPAVGRAGFADKAIVPNALGEARSADGRLSNERG